MGFIDRLTAGILAPMPSIGANQSGVLSPLADESHLGDIVLSDMFPGVNFSGLAPTRATAMRVAAVSSARDRIAQAIGGMPLLSSTSSPSPLLDSPEAGRPRAVTMAWTVDQMLFHGRAWWAVTARDGLGYPVSVELLFEEDVTYDHDRAVLEHSDGRSFSARDVIRIDAMRSGVLSTAGDVLSRAALIEAAAARASNNPVPSVELHQVDGDPLTRSQIDSLVSSWARARAGANGGVAFTSPSVDVRTHGVAAEQLLISGRNLAALDVARAMGVPAWAIDAQTTGSNLTYSNTPSRSRELLDFSLRPYMDAIEGRLSMLDVTPPGVQVRIDPIRLLRGDFADRMAAGKVAIEAGIYNHQEIRAMETESFSGGAPS